MFEARLSCEGFTPARCGRFHYISQLWHFGNILTFIRPALLGHGHLQRRKKRMQRDHPTTRDRELNIVALCFFGIGCSHRHRNYLEGPSLTLNGSTSRMAGRAPPVTRKPGTARRAAWIPEWDKMGKRPQNRTTKSVPVMAVVRGFIKTTVKEKIPEDSINHVPVTELAEKNDSLRRCDEIEVSDCADIDSDTDSTVVGGALTRFEGFTGSCKGR